MDTGFLPFFEFVCKKVNVQDLFKNVVKIYAVPLSFRGVNSHLPQGGSRIPLAAQGVFGNFMIQMPG